MGKKRWVDTDFWTDPWVIDHLNPLDRHLFMYLFTNPQTNLSGAYELSLRLMSFQTGIESEELVRMLKRLEPKAYYVDGYIILKNGVKNQNYKNENIKEGILREIRDLKSILLQHIDKPKDFGDGWPETKIQQEIL